MFNKKREEKSAQSEYIDRYVTSLKKKEKERNKIYDFKKKRMFKRRWPIALCCFLLILVGAAAALYFFDIPYISDIINFKRNSSVVVELPEENTENPDYGVPDRPVKIFATTIVCDTDFKITDNAETSKELISKIKARGLTSIFIKLNYNTGLITDTEEGLNYLNNLITYATEKEISIFALMDIKALVGDNMTEIFAFEELESKVKTVSGIKNLSGFMISNPENLNSSESFMKYIKAGNLTGYKQYSENSLTALIKNLWNMTKQTNPKLYFGLICDMVYQSTETSETGLKANTDTELLRDKNADVILWLKNKYFDGVFVNITATTEDENPSFKSAVDWWCNNIPTDSDIGFVLPSDLAAKGEGSWKNPDRLTGQLMTLNTLNRYTFCFNSYNAMENDKTEASKVAYKYITGEIEEDYVLSNLTLTSPAKKSVTVYDNIISFVGASDPNFELTLDGAPVERTEYGYFSLTKELKVGKNNFTFTHKGNSETYTINYRYVVLKDYAPTAAVTLESGSTLIVRTTARKGSTVTATLNGKTISLGMTTEETDTEFATFVGGFTLGEYEKTTSLGKITFKGICNGVTESYKSGNITVKASPKTASDILSSAINSQGSVISANNYIGVGNTLIAEVAKYQIETFDGNTLDDLSQPYNSYLPLGTVDYCSEKTSYDPSSGNTFRTLRYGKRVYTVSKGIANIKTLRGTLPSFNKLNAESVVTQGRHTVLTLNSYWKAPFTLTLSPQKYYGGTGNSRGLISSATYKYVDITFCYATIFNGDLSALANSPIFSKAELIKGTSDYTLRLHLKKAGQFYGWTANYDSKGNLVFKFLNPASAQKANNQYGATLNGIVIAVDAGHGGSDGGASGSVAKYDEADRNLFLANQIATKLKAIGATVVMTRTADTSLTNDERILKVKNASPDLAVSVHRNSSVSSKPNGFDSYYFNPYTALPAIKIKNRMSSAGTYKSCDIGWHYFFLSRISDCPVVLTENGFMSNSTDYNNMMNSSWNSKCADAIVQGIVDYFLEIG